MTLKQALSTLPDDRGTKSAVRAVLTVLEAHRGDEMGCAALARLTGLSTATVGPVVEALAHGGVVDCAHESEGCVYDPGTLVELEVSRFLRSAGTHSAKLQDSVSKFRDRYGRG